MNSNNITLDDLKIGIAVDINPQNDRTRKIIVSGLIRKILTTAKEHPHGILVELESGEKGRVKAIRERESIEIKRSNYSNEIPPAPKFEDLIGGENHTVEFKESALWSSNFTNDDIKNHKPQSRELHEYGKHTSKFIIAKSLSAFLNSDGGVLTIGAFEHKDGRVEIVGIEQDFNKLKDKTIDGYRRMLVDLFKDLLPSTIFNHLNDYLQIYFEEIEDKTICHITARKSDERVFIKIKNVEHFYIRADASIHELSGSAIINYCEKRFLKK